MIAKGQESFGVIDEHYRTDENRDLYEAYDPCEQSHNDERSAKYVCKNDIVRNGGSREVRVYTGGRHVQLIHVGDEIQPLVSDKHAENDPGNIQITRTMRVTPFLNVGDDTHGRKFWWPTKFTKIPAQQQGTQGRILCV